MPRGVGDREIRLDVHDHRLGSHTTGPEHGHFAFMNIDGIAEFRMVDVFDPDDGRVADVDRASMHLGELGCDSHGLHDLFRRDRPHGDDHLSGKNTGGNSIDPRDVHGDIAAHGVVPHFDACLDHFRFKTKRAADQKAHEIIAPELFDICVFSGADAFFIDPVPGEIFCDVAVLSDELCEPASGVQDLQHRAGFGVALCEEKEIIGMLFAEHDEICLRVTGTQAAGGLRKTAFADDVSHFDRG